MNSVDRQRKARVDRGGRGISVPKEDVNPERLKLKRFSWDQDQPKEARA